jgi:hypothetical protein
MLDAGRSWFGILFLDESKLMENVMGPAEHYNMLHCSLVFDSVMIWMVKGEDQI